MKTPRKFVFVCQVFHPDTAATSQLFSSLLDSLTSRGWSIEVLCGFPTDYKRSNIGRRAVWGDISIRRCGINVPGKKNLISRIIAYASYTLEVGFRLIGTPRNTGFLGVTNPPFMIWILALVCSLTSKRFAYIFLDLYPEGLIALGTIRSERWYVKIWSKVNGWAYKKALSLSVLGRDMVPILWRNYRIPREELSYLPHWSNVEDERPADIERSKYIRKWKLQGKFIVQYSGNMGLWHDIETFVLAAKELQVDPRVIFVFIGSGMRRKSAELLARRLNLKNTQWQDFVDLPDLSESLAASHIGLISLREGLEGVAVPSKLYGIMASGRMVLAQVPLDSEVAYTVTEHNCGVVVQPGDVDALSDTIRQLSNDSGRVKEYSSNSFEAYRRHYTVQNAAEKIESELLKLMS